MSLSAALYALVTFRSIGLRRQTFGCLGMPSGHPNITVIRYSHNYVQNVWRNALPRRAKLRHGGPARRRRGQSLNRSGRYC
jgi:hypothetical protein